MFDSLFPSHWTTLRKLMWLKLKGASAVWDTISGNPVSFSAKAAPLRKLQVAFSPVQSGTGDPSPDNVRPISGWSSLTVEQMGTNVWDGQWEIGGINDSTGEPISVTTQKRSKNYISVVPEQAYYMNTPNIGNAGVFGYAYDANHSFIDRIRLGTAVHLENKSFTTPTNCRYILIKIGSSSYDTEQMSINYPATDTAYHAYNPSSRSISISLGSTVYSGYVDVVTGVGEIDWVGMTIDDSGTAARLGYGSYPYLLLSGGEIYKSSENPCLALASNAVPTSVNNDYIVRFANGIGGVSSLADFQTLLHNNPMQLVVALKDPIPIQLTPQEVSSLLGDNVMWSDLNGDLTVEYRSN